MAVLKNRAGVSTATTGTGTITLGSALAAGVAPNAAAWQTFAAAGVANADQVRYLILDSNGAWEYGTGTYTSSGTTLSRASGAMDGTVAGQKSSSGSLLSLSGNAQVFIAAIAEDLGAAVAGPTSGSRVLIQTQVVSTAVAAINFITGIDATYDEYELHVLGMMPSTDGVTGLLQVSADGGATWQQAANYVFVWHNSNIASASGANGGTSTGMNLGPPLSNTNKTDIRINFALPSTSGFFKIFNWNGGGYTSGGSFVGFYGSASPQFGTGPINAVRVIVSGGNIAAGTYNLYGIVK
jgi:hypothetical protein